MEPIEKIKAHYNFTTGDAANLKQLKPVMEKYKNEFPMEFYHYIKTFEDTPKFLKDEEIIRRHQDGLKQWFMDLFSGEYTTQYLRDIERIGYTHVKINLPAHYVNAAMHFVRQYCLRILEKEFCTDINECRYLAKSVDKIIDINLDVITSSFIEEEIKTYFLSEKVESYLIQFANRFAYGLNLILVMGLVIMGIMVMGLFAYDVSHIFSGDLEKGLLGTLGSLLMMWVVIELMDTEVKHLKGGKFAVKVFISVALVAVIRKLLVATLKAEALEYQLSLILIGAIAVLGVIYWLIARVERMEE
ncbi:MAG: phosphate-starvation-inducible PsiE family protein [Deltaproteobacteria bacterium]|nr:phosphate-starvation-inducible PsiE family protein [Deltaproteobacteria bacterium]